MKRAWVGVVSVVLLAVAAIAGGEPAGPIIARVYYPNPTALNQWAARLDIFSVRARAGYFEGLLLPDQLTDLALAGFVWEVDAARTARLNQPLRMTAGQRTGIPSFPCYRTVEETYAAMQQLAAAHTNLATWTSMGNSWARIKYGAGSGYPLYALVLSHKASTAPKARFFLIAAIHARELATAELAARYAELLAAGYGVDPDITWLLDYNEIHIVFQSNPDGRKIAEQGYYQRKNIDSDSGSYCANPPTMFEQMGVDLNRNAGFKWSVVGSSADPCDPTFRGGSAASEPEEQALEAYMRALFPDQRGPGDSDPAPAGTTGLFITLHSYGGMVLFPWGWTTTPAPNSTALQTLGRKFGFHNRYEVAASGAGLYLASGGTDDWAYGALGIAAYTFEVGNDFFEGCATFASQVLTNNLNALLYAAKAARRPYQTPGGPDTLSVTASASSVAQGQYATLCARANDTRYYSNGHGEELVHNIAAARYSVDAPSWVAGTATLAMAPVDGAWDAPVEDVTATIDTGALAKGRHTLYVESCDSSGTWGPPSAIFLDASETDDFWILMMPALRRPPH